MKSLCSSTAAIIFAMTLILSIGVILSLSRTHPSSSPSVSKMSQSSKSLSDSLFHIEDQKSTEEPVVAASLKRIPPSTPNPIQNYFTTSLNAELLAIAQRLHIAWDHSVRSIICDL
ncbi:hypothetical protein JHK87_036606 [Glycine soja]|nr:hypothetical protein JHK87_036606 [Glycine soja]